MIIPKWVIKNQLFGQYVIAKFDECSSGNESPFDKVHLVKECMYFASDKIKGELCEQQLDQPGHRLHVLLKLWRCLRSSNWSAIQKLVNRFSSLMQYVDLVLRICCNPLALEQNIAQAFNDNTKQEMHDLEANSSIK